MPHADARHDYTGGGGESDFAVLLPLGGKAMAASDSLELHEPMVRVVAPWSFLSSEWRTIGLVLWLKRSVVRSFGVPWLREWPGVRPEGWNSLSSLCPKTRVNQVTSTAKLHTIIAVEAWEWRVQRGGKFERTTKERTKTWAQIPSALRLSLKT